MTLQKVGHRLQKGQGQDWQKSDTTKFNDRLQKTTKFTNRLQELALVVVYLALLLFMMCTLLPNQDTFLIGKSVTFFSAAWNVRHSAHLGVEYFSHAPLIPVFVVQVTSSLCTTMCALLPNWDTFLIGKSVTSLSTFQTTKVCSVRFFH